MAKICGNSQIVEGSKTNVLPKSSNFVVFPGLAKLTFLSCLNLNLSLREHYKLQKNQNKTFLHSFRNLNKFKSSTHEKLSSRAEKGRNIADRSGSGRVEKK